MEENCIFCKIAAKEIPGNFVYEDEQIVAFHDISPAAPIHVIVIPKKHIESLLGLTAEDEALMGHLMLKIPAIAKMVGADEHGFRLVVNTKEEAGQTVPHVHFHIIGGRSMQWPPG